ncbi:J domain-containing protein [Argonema antarcticum]|uniref:J domain-containing protein n=1 Tax=Argonema antarcticum TaxID=2942763 RepID=UPI0020115346|nr:DnaJ domain-containing protein [Argonema antarcticum]MCL1472158.1 DnaJ domain-containing protein [Argonema antarcticum A004/B2]
MADPNHYETLQVSPQATQAEIKRSYRQLAKLYHPDSQHEKANHEQIVELNAAYEILGDPHQRQSYDRQLRNPSPTSSGNWQQRTKAAQREYQKQRQNARDTDEQIQQWLNQVYQPVNRLLCRILNPLKAQIDNLSADPFDDELLEAFQDYLKDCRDFLEQAQLYFRSMPNPAQVAGVAATLYYCLNQLGDGIDELEFFTFNYDDRYLHTGHEMFRIAAGLRREAQAALKNVA